MSELISMCQWCSMTTNGQTAAPKCHVLSMATLCYSVVNNVVAVCSRVTRSWTVAMARKHHRAAAASHRSPYWMRRPRAANADANIDDSASDRMLQDTDRDAAAGCDSLRSSVSTQHACICGAELSTSSPRTHKTQPCNSHCVSSRSSRLSVKGSSGARKPINSEAAGRLLESKCNEVHSSAGCESLHSRLHCGDAGECWTCSAAPSSDSMGVLSGPSDCNHSSCPRLSSASTHVDRPWVCTRPLVGGAA